MSSSDFPAIKKKKKKIFKNDPEKTLLTYFQRHNWHYNSGGLIFPYHFMYINKYTVSIQLAF